MFEIEPAAHIGFHPAPCLDDGGGNEGGAIPGFRHRQGPAFVARNLDMKKRLSLCVFVGRTVVGAIIDRHAFKLIQNGRESRTT